MGLYSGQVNISVKSHLFLAVKEQRKLLQTSTVLLQNYPNRSFKNFLRHSRTWNQEWKKAFTSITIQRSHSSNAEFKAFLFLLTFQKYVFTKLFLLWRRFITKREKFYRSLATLQILFTSCKRVVLKPTDYLMARSSFSNDFTQGAF